MSDGMAAARTSTEAVDWEQRYRTLEVIARRRLAIIDNQDAEIGDLRRQLAAMRERAK